MDYNKIGKFISSERKLKKLNQMSRILKAKIEEEHEGGAADGERDMDNGTTAGH